LGVAADYERFVSIRQPRKKTVPSPATQKKTVPSPATQKKTVPSPATQKKTIPSPATHKKTIPPAGCGRAATGSRGGRPAAGWPLDGLAGTRLYPFVVSFLPAEQQQSSGFAAGLYGPPPLMVDSPYRWFSASFFGEWSHVRERIGSTRHRSLELPD
jgi:hypothetical protein